MTASNTPSWSRLNLYTEPYDDDVGCNDGASTVPATPVSMKLPIKTRIPFPQTLPLRMELPIRAMLSVQHEPETPEVKMHPQQLPQHTPEPGDCDCHDTPPGCDDAPHPLPAERTMTRLVARSPYWQAQQASFIARNRNLDELTLLRQAVQDLDGKVEQFRWPEPLKVQTEMSADDVRRIENCENAVLGYADQLKQHEAQLQSTQVQLKTTQAQLGRVEDRLQAYDTKLDAILERLNVLWRRVQGGTSSVAVQAAAKRPPAKAARKVAAKKAAQP